MAKPLFLLITLVCPLQAELLAHFHTTQGDVTVTLKYDKAPHAVANFITLAQGTRRWLDPATGAIRMMPYYDGTKFHRVNNNAVYKFAQGGSRAGDGSDGPGYTIKDEFDPALTQVPYSLSMANCGPNSNGSGFFLTGSIATPSYDGNYTVFGNVNDPASKTVVDQIIAAGPDGTTVNTVTFSRTDPTATAFNEHAQDLPVVSQAKGHLAVSPGIAATWHLDEVSAPGDVFQAFRSTTLVPSSWQKLPDAFRHNGLGPVGSTPAIAPVDLDGASAPKAFYHLTYVRHPGSVTPSTLADLVVTMSFGLDALIYTFDSSGESGTADYIVDDQAPVTFLFALVESSSEAHAYSFIVKNNSTAVPGFLQCRIGCDAASDTVIVGRHVIDSYVSYPDPTTLPFGSGSCKMTR